MAGSLARRSAGKAERGKSGAGGAGPGFGVGIWGRDLGSAAGMGPRGDMGYGLGVLGPSNQLQGAVGAARARFGGATGGLTARIWVFWEHGAQHWGDGWQKFRFWGFMGAGAKLKAEVRFWGFMEAGAKLCGAAGPRARFWGAEEGNAAGFWGAVQSSSRVLWEDLEPGFGILECWGRTLGCCEGLRCCRGTWSWALGCWGSARPREAQSTSGEMPGSGLVQDILQLPLQSIWILDPNPGSSPQPRASPWSEGELKAPSPSKHQ